MGYHLASDVHVAKVDGDLVFLNVPADAYVCLPQAADTLHSRSYGFDFADPEVRDCLLDAGLVTTDRPAALGRALPRPPGRDLLDSPSPDVGPGDIVDLLISSAKMARRYRRRSLQHIVEHARRRGGGLQPGGGAPDEAPAAPLTPVRALVAVRAR